MSIENILKLAKRFEKTAMNKEDGIRSLDNIIKLANECKQHLESPEEFINALSVISEDLDKLIEFGYKLNAGLLSGEIK